MRQKIRTESDDMEKSLYVFDLDGTLKEGDCVRQWIDFLQKKGIISPDDFPQDIYQTFVADYDRGDMCMDGFIHHVMAPLAQMPIDTIKVMVDECVETDISPTVFVEATALIADLKQDKIDMIIISASMSFLVESTARYLGIPNALGIDLVEKNLCYGTKILGVPSYQEGKVTRLKQWLASQQDKAFSRIHFYTDSINDLPLCHLADEVCLVNPNDKFKRQGQANGWSVLTWHTSKS